MNAPTLPPGPADAHADAFAARVRELEAARKARGQQSSSGLLRVLAEATADLDRRKVAP